MVKTLWTLRNYQCQLGHGVRHDLLYFWFSNYIFFLVCLQNTIVRIESVFFRQIILRVFWQIKTNFYRNWIEIIFRSHSCKCCLKIEELKLENLWTKLIYFWSHTLMDWKSKSWNGKRTFQTTSKMNFRHLLGKSDIFRSRLLLHIDPNENKTAMPL